MRSGGSLLLSLVAGVFLTTGCPAADDDDAADDDQSSDDDGADDDTADDDTQDDDDDTGDDDTGDDDAGDDDTCGDDDSLEICDSNNAVWVPGDHGSIQSAINAVVDGQMICVEGGAGDPEIYYEHVDFLGKAIHVHAPGGPSRTLIEIPPWEEGTAVKFVNGEGPDSILSGFAIAGGSGTLGSTMDGFEVLRGGGILIESSSPTLWGVSVSHNSGEWGGGIFINNGTLAMENAYMGGNNGGGHIYAEYSDILLDNVLIIGGSTIRGGGGIRLRGSSLDADNLAIAFVQSNSVGLGGGMMLTENSTAVVRNATIVANDAAGSGGGIYLSDSSIELVNTIIAENDTSTGGIDATDSSVNLQYCDVWGHPQNYVGTADLTGQFGNLSIIPSLIDIDAQYGSSWDLHLATSSSLIDCGDPASLDPDGSRSDIGVYAGPGANRFDIDLDGYRSWWIPGEYDPATSPCMDCDDWDSSVYPGAGC